MLLPLLVVMLLCLLGWVCLLPGLSPSLAPRMTQALVTLALFCSPVIALTEYTYVEYIDHSLVPVCYTRADSLWPKVTPGSLSAFAFTPSFILPSFLCSLPSFLCWCLFMPLINLYIYFFFFSYVFLCSVVAFSLSFLLSVCMSVRVCLSFLRGDSV